MTQKIKSYLKWMKEEFILKAGSETTTPIKLMSILAASLPAKYLIFASSFLVVVCSALM